MSLRPCSIVPPLHPLRVPSQETAPPPPDLQVGVGPSKGKCSVVTQECLPGGGQEPPFRGNSLLRKHHGLILDLPMQGQDVIIDERALWGGEADKGCRPRASICLGGLTAFLGMARSGGQLWAP